MFSEEKGKYKAGYYKAFEGRKTKLKVKKIEVKRDESEDESELSPPRKKRYPKKSAAVREVWKKRKEAGMSPSDHSKAVSKFKETNKKVTESRLTLYQQILDLADDPNFANVKKTNKKYWLCIEDMRGVASKIFTTGRIKAGRKMRYYGNKKKTRQSRLRYDLRKCGFVEGESFKYKGGEKTNPVDRWIRECDVFFCYAEHAGPMDSKRKTKWKNVPGGIKTL